MKIIGSQKLLFFKTAGIGLFITVISGVLLFISDSKPEFSGWVTVALGLLPLLCFLLFSYLLYRHFESFAGHSAALRQVLKREKPGVEIFRRDHHLVKTNSPELGEIFSLIDENLAEKGQFKRSLDILTASLSVIREKGYNQTTAAKIIEIIVNSTGSFGGVVFTTDQSDDSIEVLGKYNFPEDQITFLSQSGPGLGFLRAAQKQGALQRHSAPASKHEEEPWKTLFENYRHVLTIPLTFKSHLEGLLVLSSLEQDLDEQIPDYLSELISGLMAAVTYGMAMEREKSARYDKTKILQETSLAISSTLDLPSVLQVVAVRLTDYASASYCLILLNSDIENIVEVASFYTKRQKGVEPPDSARINLAEFPKISEAMAAKRTLILGPEDISEFSSVEKRLFGADKIRYLTILPISHSATSIGSVILGEERSMPRANLAPDRMNFVQAIVSQAASAIENARLYGFINRKVDQLTTLYNVSAAIHSEMDVNTMLNKVLMTAEDYLHYTAAAIFPGDGGKRLSKPLANWGFDLERDRDSFSLDGILSVAELAAFRGSSVVIDDTRVDIEARPTFVKTLSELAVPIKIGERIIGVFSVGSSKKCAFTELDESFLRALTAQIAVAMERIRLFEQERERGIKLKTIFEFSRKLSRSLNVQEVLRIATESIQEAFGYQLVAIFIPDQVNKRFYIGHQAAFRDKRLPTDFTVPMEQGLLGRAVDGKKTIYCPDVVSDSNYILAVDDVRSEVCIPIIVADKSIGVLDVESMNFDDFTPEDISTLEALADIMAVAIDNSYLFEETIEKAERLSLIDNINKAISATLDLDSFFRVVARAVADNAGYRWTSLVVPEGDSFAFKAGYTPKSAGVISTVAMLDMLRGKLGSVIARKEPEFVSFSQLVGLGAPEKLQSVIDAGIRNLALFPIGDSTRAEAVMIVGTSRSDGFSSAELQLLKDLAVHLRIAWQNAQLFKQLKTAYEQLQEAQDRIIQTEKLRALGEMSSGVVHDFNNILAAILGRIQIVGNKLGSFEDWTGRQFLEKNLDLIEKAAMDGSQILSRISEFTKKKPTEKFVEVQIDQIIQDTIELTRPRWKEQSISRGNSIDVRFNGSGCLKTTGSPAELREVFTNLIINASDAIEGDGKIVIEARQESETTIKVVVEDTGHGMAPETSKKIFEPFFTTKGARGTGLGLSVTYGIISRHKGSIEVESELGRGTKFSIALPIRELGQDETKSIPIAPQPRGGSVLVVDDEEQFREILVEILASGGYEAAAAADVQAAFQMLESNAYDLVITDLGMSGLSGWDLADAIHQNHPEMGIIMATGWGANLEPEKLALHHVDSLICKPFKIDEIMTAVEKTMKRTRDEVFVE